MNNRFFVLFFCFFLSMLTTNTNATVSHENVGYTLGVVYQGGTLTDSNLNALTAAGVNALKFQIYWTNTTQPTRNGAIDINSITTAMALAKTHGIQKFFIDVTQANVPDWFNVQYPGVAFVDNNGTNRTGGFSAFRFACATDTTNFVNCAWQQDFNNFFTQVVSYFASDSNVKWIEFGNELNYSLTYWEDFSFDSNRAYQNYLKDLNGDVNFWNSRWSLKSAPYSCNGDDTNFECIVPVSNFGTSTRNDKNLVDWLTFRQVVLRNYFIQLYNGGKSVCPSCNIVASIISPYYWKQDVQAAVMAGVNPAFIDGNFTDDLATSGYGSYPDVTFAKSVADKLGKNYVMREAGTSGGYATSNDVYSTTLKWIAHGIDDIFIYSYGNGTAYDINSKLDGVKRVSNLLANLDANLFSRKSKIGIFYPEEITLARQSSITESSNYFNFVLYALTYRFGITPEIIYPQNIFSDYNRLYKTIQKSLVRNNNFSDINSLFIPVYYADQNIQNMINYDLNSWVNSGGTVISQVTNSGSDYLPYCTTLANKTFGSNGLTTLGNYSQKPDLNTVTTVVNVFSRLTDREPFTNPNTWLAVWDLNADRNAIGVCNQQSGKRIFVGGNFFNNANNYLSSISNPALDEIWLSILRTTDTNAIYRTDDWNISGKFVNSNDLNYLIIYNNASVARSDFNISIKDANNNQRNSTDIYSVSGHFFVNRLKDGNISHFSLGANDLNIFALTDFNNMAMVVREGQDSNWAKIYNIINKLVDSQIPIWIASNDGYTVHIDSNLTQDVNATIVLELKAGLTCNNLGNINYRSDTGKYVYQISRSDISCNQSAGTFSFNATGIEPATGSNDFNILRQINFLPNGEAMVGIQYDANSDYLGQHKGIVAPADQTNITRFSASYNTLVIDIPAKFVWTKYTGNSVADFNFDAYDALCSYAYSKGMYCKAQMIVDTTGYWNVDYYTFLDSNFTTTKTVWQNNYPNTTPSWSTDNNKLSMYDADTNTIYFYANSAMANHYAPADKNYMASYIVNPNEGFTQGLAPQNTADANIYWQTVCLPSYYANLAAANTAYEKSYGGTDFNTIPIPTDRTNFNPTQQYDWWKCKSQKAAQFHAEQARALKTPDANKIVVGVKLTGDNFYPSGTGSVGYVYGLDTNVLVSKMGQYIDMVGCDIYPDTANVRNQAVIASERIGWCTALGDKISVPVDLTEFYNSTTSGNDSTHDANLNSTLLSIALANVGSTIDSGVRAISVFTCNGGYGDKRDICGTPNETMFSQRAKEIKYVLKNSLKNGSPDFAVCDNTNINIAFNLDYVRHDMLDGFLSSYLPNDNNTIKFYFNSDCNKATEKVMYANPVNIWSNDLVDLNSWIASGHTLITGFRFADGNQTNRRDYGYESTGQQISGRTPLGDYLTGLTGTTTTVQANKLLDVNINAGQTLFTNLAAPTRIFSYQISSDRNVDYEVGSTGSGAVKEAVITATTGSGSGGAAITSRVIGLGKAVHFSFNLLPEYSLKDSSPNANQAMRDIIISSGKPLQSTVDSNYFAWSNPYYSVINSFGTTASDFNVSDTITQIYVMKSDGNTISYQAILTPLAYYQMTPSLTNGQTKSVLKGNLDVNTIAGNQTSTLYIDGNIYSQTFPVAITTNTNTSVIIDSNVVGDLNHVTLHFTNTICPSIGQIRIVNADRTIDKNITSGWVCAGNNVTLDVNGIQDTNTTNKNYLILQPLASLDIVPPVTTWDGNHNTLQTFDALIHLTCTDDDSGCNNTKYSLNGGTWTNYTTPVLDSIQGNSTFAFYSTDNAGNTETTQTYTIKIDKTGIAIRQDNGVCGMATLMTIVLAIAILLTAIGAIATMGAEDTLQIVVGGLTVIIGIIILIAIRGMLCI